MSLESKHSYRFNYLRSEEWKNIRIAALAEKGCACEICGEDSPSNDAHHIWYPQNIYDTTTGHLAILCRGCHDFTHVMIPECKTSERELGMKHWSEFKTAIQNWRLSKFDPSLYDKIKSKETKANNKIKDYVMAAELDERYDNDKSRDIIVHVSDMSKKGTKSVYKCRTRFFFQYSFGLLTSIPNIDRIHPTKSVAAFWNTSLEIRGVIDMSNNGILLIPARALSKALDGRTILAEIAAVAYLKCLPDDWPCFISANVGRSRMDDPKIRHALKANKHTEKLQRYMAKLSEKNPNKFLKLQKALAAGRPSQQCLETRAPANTMPLQEVDPITPSPPTS